MTDGPRPFVTQRALRALATGGVVHWQARAHRKAVRPGPAGLTWWTALLFAIGIGLLRASARSRRTPTRSVPGADAYTFFVGSLFFTTAGYLTYVQVVREDGHRWFGWMPRHLGFWAALDPAGRHASTST